MAKYKFKSRRLYHYTIQKDVYLAIYLQYNSKLGTIGIYQFLRFNGGQLGFRRLKKIRQNLD